MVSRTNYVQQYKKSENKQKEYLKALKNQNKMIYRISKKPRLCREIKKIKKIKKINKINKIKKIRAKSSKKNSYSSNEFLDSDSLLAINRI